MGFLSGGAPPSPVIAPLLAALAERGYTEGRNLVVQTRYAGTRGNQLPSLAAELVRAKVDVIVTVGSPAAPAAKKTTATVPIVFSLASDPVERGLVKSFARPGGNLTGFVLGVYEDKALQILKEAFPGVRRVAVLWSTRADAPPSRPGLGCGLGPKTGQNTIRLAAIVDKILKGARPGDIPVEQPTVFELVVNEKSAKTLGLTIPRSILARADVVIDREHRTAQAGACVNGTFV